MSFGVKPKLIQPGAFLRAADWRGAPGFGRKEKAMLRIYWVLIELVRDVRPVIDEIEKSDGDLARQCRRAMSSAPLNVAEGSHSQGRIRGARYHTACGSLREGLACLEVAAAWGYVKPVSDELRARFDHVIGTLVKARR